MIKRIFRSPVAALLAVGSRLIMRKYRPQVVMITGSVGKTSAKDAVAAALANNFYLRKNEKSYNTEFGVPLTIIGAVNPWTNPFSWLFVFKEMLALIFLPNHYPKLLVLEVGADRPGDLARILRIVSPDAVIVTRLPDIPVHVEAYPSPQAVRDEEFTPAYALPAEAPLIICADDPHVVLMAKRLPVRVMTFGFAENADVHASEPAVYEAHGKPAGMEASLVAAGEHTTLHIAGGLGRHQLYAPLAAIATALSLGMTLSEALAGLKEYQPPPGRSRILSGKNDSLIIDDSYNASPAAAEEALRALETLPRAKRLAVPAGRRIAVLGDMLELGRYSVSEHERIGALAAKQADILITVGIRARGIAEGAMKAGMDANRVRSFQMAKEASDFLSPIISEGDVILVKGSQNKIRLERVAEALLENPADAAKLVRQERRWKLIA